MIQLNNNRNNLANILQILFSNRLFDFLLFDFLLLTLHLFHFIHQIKYPMIYLIILLLSTLTKTLSSLQSLLNQMININLNIMLLFVLVQQLDEVVIIMNISNSINIFKCFLIDLKLFPHKLKNIYQIARIFLF